MIITVEVVANAAETSNSYVFISFFDNLYSWAWLHPHDIYENGFKKKTFFSWRDDEARESTYNMLSIVIIAIRFEVDA